MEKLKEVEYSNLESKFQNLKSILDISSISPKRVSAEFSILNALKNEEELFNEFTTTIFYTKSHDGKLAALINQYIISKYFNADVKIVEIDNVDVKDRIKLKKSFGDFMQKLSNTLLEQDKEYTFFAPIGGYKVLTYLAYVVGSFFGYQTGYLYEDAQVLMKIPPMPIKIDLEWIVESKDLLLKLKRNVLTFNELSDDEKEFIEDNSFFFEIVEDAKDTLVTLNVYGDFLISDYLETKKLISEDVLNTIRNSDSKFVLEKILEMVKKIKLYYSSYEKPRSLENSIKHNFQWGFEFPYLYKGGNGKNVFRALWDYNQYSDTITIYKIWLNHDDYENDCNYIKNNSFNTNVKLVEID
ncbi:hypothetical protein [Fonticella tunisiensis]|nr:hypothetical protein [Fonticella tunisiensis]